MAGGKLLRGSIPAVFLRWASGLRFPVLFVLTALLFVLDLFVPDVLPFADELLLGLATLLLANWRKSGKDAESNATTEQR